MPTQHVDETRLARFADDMLASPKVRVDHRRMWRAFSRAYPDTPASEQRTLLLQSLLELANRGIVGLPSPSGTRWDRAQIPHVPSSVDLIRPKHQAKTWAWREHHWHPRLSWVSDLPRLPAAHQYLLRKLNDAIIGDQLQERVPFKYRSLQLTRDEKELDSLLKSSLFGPGRLDLSDLNCDREVLPMACHRVGTRRSVIIFENPGPFHVARNVLAEMSDPPYGLVACGSGNSVTKSIAYLATFEPAVDTIDYVGDLDIPGLRIALRAGKAAQHAGLPAVRPASALHIVMLDQRSIFHQDAGWPHIKENADTKDIENLLSFLDPAHREQVRLMLSGGRRVPEEVLGPAELRRALAIQGPGTITSRTHGTSTDKRKW